MDPIKQWDAQQNVSYVRGIGFGCLYAFLSWLGICIVALVIMAVIVLLGYDPGGSYEESGARISKMTIVFISIPIGIWGYMRHRRKASR